MSDLTRLMRLRPWFPGILSLFLVFSGHAVAAGVQTANRDTEVFSTAIARGIFLTIDESIAVVKAVVFWRIADQTAYEKGLAEPEDVLPILAEAAVRNAVVAKRFEEVRTIHRGQVAQLAEKNLQATLDKLEAGVEVVGVRLNEVGYPPRAQVSARKRSQARQKLAEGENALFYEEQEALRNLREQAKQIVDTARSDGEAQLQKAKRDTQIMLGLYEEYLASGDEAERAGYLAAIREIYENR